MIKRVTLKQVAARAGVSYQTVSKVINHKVRVSAETERRIRDSVRELGYMAYYPARSLRSQNSHTIGYTWEPSPMDQANPILDQFLQSMFSAAEKRGYYLLCFPHLEPSKRLDVYRNLIDTGRVDGFVLSGINYDDPYVAYLCERKFPFVVFGHMDGPLSFPNIDVDGGLGIHMAVDHLLSLGHRKISVLAWPADSRVGNDRIKGYTSAMRAAQIGVRPEWVERGEGSFNFGFQAMVKMLSLPVATRPTAVVAMNDLMAIGAIAAIRKFGLRPGKDVAVTGFDDTPTARFLNTPLTSVSQPIWEIGQHLMERLILFLETGNYPDPFDELVSPALEIRESSTGIEADNHISF
jgi:DNA-binding LacI/PurR family transcriptional regulator